MSDFIYNETGYALDNDNGSIVLSAKSYQRYFARFYKDYVFYRDAEFVEVTHDYENNQFILKYKLEDYDCDECNSDYVNYGREAFAMDTDHEKHEEQGLREDYITYKIVELFIFE